MRHGIIAVVDDEAAPLFGHFAASVLQHPCRLHFSSAMASHCFGYSAYLAAARQKGGLQENPFKSKCEEGDKRTCWQG